jgi:hypothetical protein
MHSLSHGGNLHHAARDPSIVHEPRNPEVASCAGVRKLQLDVQHLIGPILGQAVGASWEMVTHSCAVSLVSSLVGLPCQNLVGARQDVVVAPMVLRELERLSVLKVGHSCFVSRGWKGVANARKQRAEGRQPPSWMIAVLIGRGQLGCRNVPVLLQPAEGKNAACKPPQQRRSQLKRCNCCGYHLLLTSISIS